MKRVRTRTAFLIPYRDRALHLGQLILQLETLLPKRGIDLYVIEQEGHRPFNKGSLLNAGFDVLEGEYSHFVFHDVDQLPIRVDYSPATRAPAHLGAELSQYGFQLPYPDYFGGVVLFSARQFKQVNGFSNHYWGWGCEDDDLYLRCKSKNLSIERRKGRFISLSHQRSLADFYRNKKRVSAFCPKSAEGEGLNSVRYRLKKSLPLTQWPVLLRMATFKREVQHLSVQLTGKQFKSGLVRR